MLHELDEDDLLLDLDMNTPRSLPAPIEKKPLMLSFYKRVKSSSGVESEDINLEAMMQETMSKRRPNSKPRVAIKLKTALVEQGRSPNDATVKTSSDDSLEDEYFCTQVDMRQQSTDVDRKNLMHKKYISGTVKSVEGNVIRMHDGKCIIVEGIAWTSILGNLAENDRLNLLFTQKLNGKDFPELVVDDNYNALIVNPEKLIPVTLLAEAFACKRKPVMHMRYALPTDFNDPDQLTGTLIMAVGSVVHAAFEAHLLQKGFDLKACVESCLPPVAQFKQVEVEEKAQALIKLIPGFLKKHGLSCKDVLTCESMLWSPALGIKGKLDALMTKNNSRSALWPLELKTGARTDSVAHRAQVLYYTLLLYYTETLTGNGADNDEWSEGRLAFLKANECVKVPVKWAELRSLLISRNSIVSEAKRMLSERNKVEDWLPKNPCQNSFICSTCAFAAICHQTNNNDIDVIRRWTREIDAEECVLRKASLLQDPDWSGLVIECKGRQLKVESLPFSTGDAIVVRMEGDEGALPFVQYSTGFVTAENCITVSAFEGHAQRIAVWLDETGMALPAWRYAVWSGIRDGRTRELFALDKPVSLPWDSDHFENIGTLEQTIRKLVSTSEASSCGIVLIHGMPGTGKTQTLAHLIKTLIVDEKLRILAIAHTNAAIDTLLERIVSVGAVPEECIFRWSSGAKLNSAVIRENCPGIIGCTSTMALDIGSLTASSFDVVIVDEAGQMALPAAIPALQRASKLWIACGDPWQLPPLIKAPENILLRRSVFEALALRKDHVYFRLTKQYRMSCKVMSLANDLLYRGQMQCANDKICWNINPTDSFMQSLVMHSILFMHNPSKDVVLVGSSRSSQSEAILVLDLLNKLIPYNCSVALICVYRGQASLLKNMLQQANLNNVLVSTVDKFQGSEADIIILLHTNNYTTDNVERRSNCSRETSNRERLCVAWTRAKLALIAIGDALDFKTGSLEAQMVQWCRLHNAIIYPTSFQ